MSIFFNVPPIGNSTGAQKGPTCWFYAAKMIRKFHDAYDKNDHPIEIRKLSVVRKIITFIDEDLKKYPGEYGFDAPRDFRVTGELAKLPATGSSDPLGLLLYRGMVRFASRKPTATTPPANPLASPRTIDLTQDDADPLAAGVGGEIPQGPPTSAEYESAFKLLLSWGRQDAFGRQAILGAWSFKAIPKLAVLDILASSRALESALVKHGPLWAGGLFGMEGLVQLARGDRVPVVHNQDGTRAWARQTRLREALGSTHSIAVLGVGTKQEPGTVLYRDPNMSNHVLSLPFDLFASRMKSDIKDDAISLMYYECPRCSSGIGGSCVNQNEKRLTVGVATVSD